METKRCPKCEQNKATTDFYPCPKRPDRLTAWCQECSKEKSREYRRRNRDKVREYNKGYRETHVEERRAARPRYREKEREGNRKWLAAHPEKASYIRRKAGAVGRGLAWNIDEDWYITNIWGRQCAYGNHPSDGGIDRIDNSVGYTVDNCVPCCWWCNSIKGEHTLDEMYQHITDMLAHRRDSPVAPSAATREFVPCADGQ